MRALTFKIGGIHPPQDKTTSAEKIFRVDLPMVVAIPLKQHVGAEAVPIVKKGDHVKRGQKIAEAVGVISAPVHASISGIVKSIAPIENVHGRLVNAITIAAADDDHEADMQLLQTAAPERDYMAMESNEIIAEVANGGVVGLGGATFPAAVKLNPPKDFNARLILINACECEPGLTCDDALMRAYPHEIINGTRIMMRAAQVERAIIGIEDNKPEAYKAVADAAKGSNIEVRLLKARYPQGCEKQFIYALTGVEVPSGQIPASIGCIVQNVGTAFAVFSAVALAHPLVERVVTIEGIANFMAPIGMKISDIISQFSRLATPDSIKAYFENGAENFDVVAGGPMMGQSAVTLDAPVVKGLSGITFYSPLPFNPQPCIRCAACVEACPMGLEPYYLAACGKNGLISDAMEAKVMDCIECGSCSYSCPSARPILDYIKLAKQKIRSSHR